MQLHRTAAAELEAEPRTQTKPRDSSGPVEAELRSQAKLWKSRVPELGVEVRVQGEGQVQL